MRVVIKPSKASKEVAMKLRHRARRDSDGDGDDSDGESWETADENDSGVDVLQV